jgi:hypothetical protein
MTDKKRPSGLEIVGGLLIIQGLISTVAHWSPATMSAYCD